MAVDRRGGLRLGLVTGEAELGIQAPAQSPCSGIAARRSPNGTVAGPGGRKRTGG
jgi:hypothetical protein